MKAKNKVEQFLKNISEDELIKETKKLRNKIDQAIADFAQARDQLFCAFIDKHGPGQVIEFIPIDNQDLTRKAWIVPAKTTLEKTEWVSRFKKDESVIQAIRLYCRACPLDPSQTQVVQFLDNTGKFITVFRKR